MAVNMNNRKRYEVWKYGRPVSAHRYRWVARAIARYRGGYVWTVR